MVRQPGAGYGGWGRGFRPGRGGQGFAPGNLMPRDGSNRPGWRQPGDNDNLNPEAAPQEQPWGPARRDFRRPLRGEERPDRWGRGQRPWNAPDVDVPPETNMEGSSAEPSGTEGYALLDMPPSPKPPQDVEHDDFWGSMRGEGRPGPRGRGPRPWGGPPIDSAAEAGPADSAPEPIDKPEGAPQTNGMEQPISQ
jgi:hypothetical protein